MRRSTRWPKPSSHAFQFERNLLHRAYCMSKRVTPQTLANWMQVPHAGGQPKC